MCIFGTDVSKMAQRTWNNVWAVGRRKGAPSTTAPLARVLGKNRYLPSPSHSTFSALQEKQRFESLKVNLFQTKR
jgi:hypothetical protein